MPTPRRFATAAPAESTIPPDQDPAPRAASQIEPAVDGGADSARRRRIAERAYGRAERRGFAPGQELDDWLAAEAEEEAGGEAEDTR